MTHSVTESFLDASLQAQLSQSSKISESLRHRLINTRATVISPSTPIPSSIEELPHLRDQMEDEVLRSWLEFLLRLFKKSPMLIHLIRSYLPSDIGQLLHLQFHAYQQSLRYRHSFIEKTGDSVEGLAAAMSVGTSDLRATQWESLSESLRQRQQFLERDSRRARYFLSDPFCADRLRYDYLSDKILAARRCLAEVRSGSVVGDYLASVLESRATILGKAQVQNPYLDAAVSIIRREQRILTQNLNSTVKEIALLDDESSVTVEPLYRSPKLLSSELVLQLQGKIGKGTSPELSPPLTLPPEESVANVDKSTNDEVSIPPEDKVSEPSPPILKTREGVFGRRLQAFDARMERLIQIVRNERIRVLQGVAEREASLEDSSGKDNTNSLPKPSMNLLGLTKTTHSQSSSSSDIVHLLSGKSRSATSTLSSSAPLIAVDEKLLSVHAKAVVDESTEGLKLFTDEARQRMTHCYNLATLALQRRSASRRAFGKSSILDGEVSLRSGEQLRTKMDAMFETLQEREVLLQKTLVLQNELATKLCEEFAVAKAMPSQRLIEQRRLFLQKLRDKHTLVLSATEKALSNLSDSKI